MHKVRGRSSDVPEKIEGGIGYGYDPGGICPGEDDDVATAGRVGGVTRWKHLDDSELGAS